MKNFHVWRCLCWAGGFSWSLNVPWKGLRSFSIIIKIICHINLKTGSGSRFSKMSGSGFQSTDLSTKSRGSGSKLDSESNQVRIHTVFEPVPDQERLKGKRHENEELWVSPEAWKSSSRSWKKLSAFFCKKVLQIFGDRKLECGSW